MTEGVHSTRVIRFGIFEVDLQSGELRKAGLKLKLTGQPFQVLAILLEHPGEVVTREELQKRLWPDTFVDIDHNLNTAINKIREALEDSAESPRFVETLPRRGYRFIGAINQENASASVPADSERLKSDNASARTAAADAVGPEVSGRLRWIGVLTALVVVLAIVGTNRLAASTADSGEGARYYATHQRRRGKGLVTTAHRWGASLFHRKQRSVEAVPGAGIRRWRRNFDDSLFHCRYSPEHLSRPFAAPSRKIFSARCRR